MTHRYTFFGRVVPERAYFHKPEPILDHDCEWPDSGIKGRLVATIYSNQIVAWFETHQALSDIATARNQIQGMVTAVVDSVALELATSYNVEFVYYVDHTTGENGLFSVNLPELRDLTTPIIHVADMNIADAALQEPLYRRAIADFRLSMALAADTGFFCYRAIESLVQYLIVSNGLKEQKDKTKAIDLLNAFLNVDAACIEFLRSKSGGVRHGKVEFISGPDRAAAIRVTRDILLRFAAWHQDSSKTWPDAVQLLKPS